MQKVNLFTILNYLTFEKKAYKDLTLDEIKQINPYMINRYLSMNRDFLELVNYVQFIPYENKESYYNVYLKLLPKKKVWLQYLKSKKEKTYNKDLLKILANYFECSIREIEEYLQILDNKDIREILQKHGFEESEIKKLLK